VVRPGVVTLPTGLTVPRVGLWLHESCPDAATRHTQTPRNMDANGHSRTHRQRKCSTCGLWAIWELRIAGKEPTDG